MKILVTGSYGQLGRSLFYHLNSNIEIFWTGRNIPFDRNGFYLDICDRINLKELISLNEPDIIINLAAQAGVRHSLKDPYSYINSNILGHLNMLELAKKTKVKKFIYASSSSVYGGNKILPFSVKQRVDSPVSIYAASKKSGELISESYAHLFGIQCIGLRFFTVYGPWGRPDMATFIFTKRIIEGKEIEVFNKGKMKRDFTFIDDIVDGIMGAVNLKIKFEHRIYNLGNNNPEDLLNFINLIEETLGVRAKKKLLPIQPGDVKETFAEISESTKDLNFIPKVNIEEGLPKFVEWYKSYYGI